jgi:hypothetical protein
MQEFFEFSPEEIQQAAFRLAAQTERHFLP